MEKIFVESTFELAKQASRYIAENVGYTVETVPGYVSETVSYAAGWFIYAAVGLLGVI